MEDELNTQPIKIVVTLRKKTETLFYLTTFAICWDSVVSITTAYGLDGPGSTPSRSKNFCNCLGQSWGSPILLYNQYHVSLPGIMQLRHDVDHPLLSSAEVKEGIELSL
jgi:hypothetical protein